MKSASPPSLDTRIAALTAAGAYRRFLANVFGRIAERPFFEILPAEIELQSLWFSGSFGRGFRSTNGQSVEIVQFGHWNHSAGPDFSDVSVSIDGKICRGAIELDTDVRDWERHRHGANDDYNEVVLHLFFQEPDGVEYFTRTAKHREVPQVRLSLDLLGDGAARHPYEAEAHLGRCASPLEAMPAPRVESLLLSAAQFRLERKATRLRRVAETQGRDEALYQGIAEALGYRPNKLPMRVLAQRATLATLRKLDPIARESLLFGMAGFLEEDAPGALPEETQRYLSSLWACWWKQRGEFGPAEERLPSWKIAGVRPGNHPHRRAAALAAVTERWPALLRIVGPGRPFSADAFLEFCEELEHPYWDVHYTLRADASDKPLALIGPSRAIEILANQVFPLLISGQADLWEAYAALPAKLGNEKVRRASTRLFGANPDRKSFLRKVYHQQALLQIYEDFCLEDDSGCVDCPFPEQLAQWR